MAIPLNCAAILSCFFTPHTGVCVHIRKRVVAFFIHVLFPFEKKKELTVKHRKITEKNLRYLASVRYVHIVIPI